MIKTIIKRNGTSEPFSAEKLNGWGEWSAKTFDHAVNWPEAVLHVASTQPEICTSEELQKGLITFCLDKKTWEYNRMAGRLYSALTVKQLYGKRRPTVKKLHDTLFAVGLMAKLNYSDEEYAEVEKIIDHSLDLKYAHYEIHQIRYKYALRNKVTGKEYESPQFVYMRMAMALAENEPADTRMYDLKKWYEHFSNKRINPPTPNFTNLGTTHNNYASCCVYTTDDTAPSLAAGDHIAYMMTVSSAGIGSHIKTRSLKDPIRGGAIEHQGKIPYYRALVGAIGANLQNGRGGAATQHYTAYDPEVEVIAKLKNPMTPAAKQVRGLDYSFGSNKFFARQAAANENIALFSYADHPDLYNAQYSKDVKLFENLYNEKLQAGLFKTFVPARHVVVNALSEAEETGRHYLHFTCQMNKHTPFNDTIWSSNLCHEVFLATAPFKNVAELYEPYKEGGGEIGLCNIGAIIASNIESDEQHADAAYYSLKMVDVTIHKSTYIFKNLEDTAKARMSAGIGIVGLAHLMAKKNLKYSSQEGRNFIHTLFETHAWHLINASLRLGQERGNAPWMHKTQWPNGWLPIDTYEKKVDNLVTVGNMRDWESLRAKIIANGGIRNSVLICHMPSESSSISSGTTNGVYPIRDFDLTKTNETLVIDYVVPDSTKLRDRYEIAWDIKSSDLIKCYAVMQKWTDQGLSADLYRRLQGTDKVETSVMLKDYFLMVSLGLKSRYYQNSLTAKGLASQEIKSQEAIIEPEIEPICESCSL